MRLMLGCAPVWCVVWCGVVCCAVLLCDVRRSVVRCGVVVCVARDVACDVTNRSDRLDLVWSRAPSAPPLSLWSLLLYSELQRPHPVRPPPLAMLMPRL